MLTQMVFNCSDLWSVIIEFRAMGGATLSYAPAIEVKVRPDSILCPWGQSVTLATSCPNTIEMDRAVA